VITTWIAADKVLTPRELFESVAAEGFSVQVNRTGDLPMHVCLVKWFVDASITVFLYRRIKTQRVGNEIFSVLWA
jgi:hypothetical protein